MIRVECNFKLIQDSFLGVTVTSLKSFRKGYSKVLSGRVSVNWELYMNGYCQYLTIRKSYLVPDLFKEDRFHIFEQRMDIFLAIVRRKLLEGELLTATGPGWGRGSQDDCWCFSMAGGQYTSMLHSQSCSLINQSWKWINDVITWDCGS